MLRLLVFEGWLLFYITSFISWSDFLRVKPEVMAFFMFEVEATKD